MAVININKTNFDIEVLKNESVVLLDFWASWCGPCRMLSPIVDQVADEKKDLKVGKVNTDEEGELARKFGIVAIPTLIVFKDGKEVNRSSGLIAKSQILDLVNV